MKSRCSGIPAAVAMPSVQHRSLTAIRHAVQLRQDLAPPDHLLGRTRLRQRQLRRDECIRLQGRIDALDPAQHGLGQLDRRDLARRDQARQLVDLEVVEVVEGHVGLTHLRVGRLARRGVDPFARFSEDRGERTCSGRTPMPSRRGEQALQRRHAPSARASAAAPRAPRWRRWPSPARARCSGSRPAAPASPWSARDGAAATASRSSSVTSRRRAASRRAGWRRRPRPGSPG